MRISVYIPAAVWKEWQARFRPASVEREVRAPRWDSTDAALKRMQRRSKRRLDLRRAASEARSEKGLGERV